MNAAPQKTRGRAAIYHLCDWCGVVVAYHRNRVYLRHYCYECGYARKAQRAAVAAGKPPPPRHLVACAVCGSAVESNHGGRQYCNSCRITTVPRMASAAVMTVRAAVIRGEIPPANTLQCVDCGEQAYGYDHRSYNRPLDVEPVCRSCNKKRGPAEWRPA